MSLIRVAIVADNRLFGEGLQRIVGAESSYLVVAAIDRETLRRKSLRQASPDVVLIDTRTSGALSLCAEFGRQAARPCVIVVGAPQDDDWAVSALESGARGILTESAGSEELVKAIRVVNDGQVWALKHVIARIVERMAALADATRRQRTLLTHRLSPREQEILQHAVEGLSNQEIAKRLLISEATVKAHLGQIFQKLGVKRRAQLASLYHRLLSPPASTD